jgi:hypothetical protein
VVAAFHREGECFDEDTAAGGNDGAGYISLRWNVRGSDLHINEFYVFALDHGPPSFHQIQLVGRALV